MADFGVLAGTFLLTLLPKVARLSLIPAWCYSGGPGGRYQKALLDAIVRRANNGGCDGASLSKLRVLEPVDPMGCVWEAREMEWLVTLMAIKSVREFYLFGVDETRRPLILPRRTLGESVERLEISACRLDRLQVLQLVLRLPSLRTFRFAYGSPQA